MFYAVALRATAEDLRRPRGAAARRDVLRRRPRDAVRLARRILRNEVRSNGLHTLAAHFRTEHKPCHRAFADAAACLEVLWALIERGAAYGITTLADLLQIQSVRSNPHFEKVKLARA